MVVLGIMLVSYSSRGHQLVFVYPASAAGADNRTGHSVGNTASSHASGHAALPRNITRDEPLSIAMTYQNRHFGNTKSCSHLPADILYPHHGIHGIKKDYTGLPPHDAGSVTAADQIHTLPHHRRMGQPRPATVYTDGSSAAARVKQTHSRHGSRSSMPIARNAFLGLDCEFLSDILSPKVALCDKQFHLTVDKVDFVGHPTLLNADRPGTGLRFARLVQKRKLVASAAHHRHVASGTSITSSGAAMGNASCPIAPSTTLDLSANNSTNCNIVSAITTSTGSINIAADTSSPPPPLSSSSGWDTVDETLISASGPHLPSLAALSLNPQSPQHQSQQHQSQQHQSQQQPQQQQHQLTMFNLVFALQSDGCDSTLHAEEIRNIYHQVITKVTTALKYEQLRRGYIRLETELILAIKERHQVSAAGGAEDMLNLQTQILNASSLARCLAHIYHAVQGHLPSFFEVNGSVSLALHTNGIHGDISNGSFFPNMHASIVQNTDPTIPFAIPEHGHKYPILRPYQALLLLSDAEEILKSLPADASPLLVELIQIVTPTQSFEELQTTLSCSLSQIYRLAAHLLPALSIEFSSRFPQIELVRILQELSIPRPYSAIAPSKESRNLYLEIITFLLRKNLVVQLHMYIYLSIPSHLCSNSTSPDRDVNSWNHAPPCPSILTDPTNLNEQEVQWIAKIANSQSPPLAALFTRLVPYFNGRVHVEEILFRESIARKDLKSVISKYRDEIVTTLYPGNLL
ncbi:hypothetical protein BSLG_007711 [Batrachochytrium salamandrivorans]|nr:hypothetical protein BSLG_007711 [Batrachochytrium salamandrivorans]